MSGASSLHHCTCAKTPGRLCAACVRLGNAGWPTGSSESSTRRHALSPAQRSRIEGAEGQSDIFEGELRDERQAAPTDARTREAERGIKAGVKRLRY